MNIDNTFLKEYFLNEKDSTYLINLYKIYELCNKSVKNIKKNKQFFDYLEDKIYTVNGKVLTQKERIIFEVKRVYKVIEKITNFDKKMKYLGELEAVVLILENGNNQAKTYEMIKQKLAVLEAKLNISINFLYSASIAFMNLYDSAYINNHPLLIENKENMINTKINNDEKIIKNYNNDFHIIKTNNKEVK